MEVEVIDQLAKLPPLQEEWDRLNQCAADSSPFSTYKWITTWAECYLGRHEPRIVIVRKDGRLVGVAPFYLTSQFGIRILQTILYLHQVKIYLLLLVYLRFLQQYCLMILFIYITITG